MRRHWYNNDMKNRLIISIAIIAVVGLIAFAATRNAAPAPAVQAQTAPVPHETADVARIEAAELRAELERGTVILLDVRDADSYIAGHIDGALHIPLSRVEGEISYLPKEKPIVAYCA
jgi:3-mercaptopyruvate sulfurtransferase SseA